MGFLARVLPYRRSVLVCVVLLLSQAGCSPTTQHASTRSSNPSEGTEALPGYLDSVERDVVTTEESEVSVNQTQVKIPRSSAEVDYRIRISRRQAPPEMTPAELTVLGDPKSDVIDIEVFEPVSGNILSSKDLLLPYEFIQEIATSDSNRRLGFMVVTDPGTANEARTLLPNSEISLEPNADLALRTNTMTASVRLKLTTATIWLVEYTDNALMVLKTGTAENLESKGGSQSKSVVTQSKGLAGALEINAGASVTSDTAVTLSLSADGAAEMYITNAPGCSDQGNWAPYQTAADWTLGSSNAVARVYVKFRSSDQQESSCVSDSITHDDIPPTAPSVMDNATTSHSFTVSPTLSWTAGADSGSGISHYEVCIGTTAGGNDIKPWTNVGNTNSVAISGLSLSEGVTYYPSVRAVDLARISSASTRGIGWTIALPPAGEPAAKGPIGPNTFSNDNSVGVHAWANVSNIATSDDLSATISQATPNNTNYLKATDFFRPDPIPAGATINGIIVSIEWKRSTIGGQCQQSDIRIIKNGSIGSVNKSDGSYITPTSDVVATIGGASDLWGESWTADDINSNLFGVAIQLFKSAIGVCLIDHVTMTVHYTP